MIRSLYIAWHKHPGDAKHIIAQIKRVHDGYSFSYLPQGSTTAKAEGLEYFLGFKNGDNFAHEDVKRLLALRIISKERSDRAQFLAFWEAEHIQDPFLLLALTQGKSPTDNFEFLANFLHHKAPSFSFVSDLVDVQLHHTAHLAEGDVLSYRKIYQPEFRVAVYHNKHLLGHIKPFHSSIFRLKRTLQLSLKAIAGGPENKQVFVRITKPPRRAASLLH